MGWALPSGGAEKKASIHTVTSVRSRADLLTEVVCNLLVQHYLLAITWLRYTQRPQVFD